MSEEIKKEDGSGVADMPSAASSDRQGLAELMCADGQGLTNLIRADGKLVIEAASEMLDKFADAFRELAK